MARRGTYQSRVAVTQPYPTIAPVQGGSILNPAAFILSNHGRSGPDVVLINSIEVIDLSYANAAAAGQFIMNRVTLNATQPTRTDSIQIIAHDSAFPVPAGLTAVPGLANITATEGVNNPLFTPSHQTSANVHSTVGWGGGMRPPPLVLQDGQGLEIKALGSSHSTLCVAATVMHQGNTYSVAADTGSRGDVVTILNKTGAEVTIADIRETEYLRATATTIPYVAARVGTAVLMNKTAKTVSFNSAAPDWVVAGDGHFQLAQDNWLDPSQILATFNVYRHTSTTGSAVNPPNHRLMRIDKDIALNAGESLVLYPPAVQISAGNAGEHDIVVTYTVDELAGGAGGGEYSYAY